MNKKLLLGLLALATAHSAAEAQSLRRYVKPELVRKAKLVSRHVATDVAPQPSAPSTAQRVQSPPSPASWGQLIGMTTYDLQTNRATANRMMVTGSNLSAVWTQTCVLGTIGTNRGAGYNYSADPSAGTEPLNFVNGTDGNCPSPFGLMSLRTGWPEIIHTATKEMVVCHASGTASGLFKTSRTIGSGTWSTPSTALTFSQNMDAAGTPASNGTWPRMVSNGDTVHLVYCSSNGLTPANAVPQNPIAQPGSVPQPNTNVISPMVYARSLDGGVTWDKANIVLPGFDNVSLGSGLGLSADTASVGGDSYAVAVNGNTVAICAHNLGTSVMMAKSTDGGTTWTARRIMGGFTDADTVIVNPNTDPTPAVMDSDGSMSMVIDNTGTVHWFSGSGLPAVRRAPNGIWVGTGTAFTDASDAFLYWNDRELLNQLPIVLDTLDEQCPAMPAFMPCGLASNSVAAGRSPYGLTGIVSMPTAVYADNGDTYVVYAGGRIGTSTNGAADGQYFRDLYVKRLSFPGGGQIAVYPTKNISRDIYNIPDGAAATTTEESVFPSAHHKLEGNFLHYQWMSDFEPGDNFQGTPVDPEVENAVMYDRIDVTTVAWGTPVVVGPVGLNETAAYVASLTTAPNPTTGTTTLNLNLRQDARATIVVRNVLGQEVLRVPASAYKAGANRVALDLSGQGSGVYFYTVTADKFSLTQRVVKQ